MTTETYTGIIEIGEESRLVGIKVDDKTHYGLNTPPYQTGKENTSA